MHASIHAPVTAAKYITYGVISSAVQQIVEGHAVCGVGQAVQGGKINTAFGCNSYDCAQNIELDLEMK